MPSTQTIYLSDNHTPQGSAHAGQFLPAIARRQGSSGMTRDTQNESDHSTRYPQQCSLQKSDTAPRWRQDVKVSSDENTQGRYRHQDTSELSHHHLNWEAYPYSQKPYIRNDSSPEAASKTRRWVTQRHNAEPALISGYNEYEVVPETHLISSATFPISVSPPSVPQHISTFHSQEIMHRKMDRKEKARRQLVGGLMGNNYPTTAFDTAADGRSREDVKRTASFNVSKAPGVESLAQGSKDGQFYQSHNRNGRGRSIRRRNSYQNLYNSHDKTKEAISNWNNFVNELQREQRQLGLNSAPQLLPRSAHLAVLSGSYSSSNSGAEVVDEDDSAQKHPRVNSTKAPMKKLDRTTATRVSNLPLTSIKFPMGIGFTRYRPITPNLLARLDRQKLSSKRRTQLWVNSIEDSRRSHLVSFNGEEDESGLNTCDNETLSGTLNNKLSSSRDGEDNPLKKTSHEFL